MILPEETSAASGGQASLGKRFMKKAVRILSGVFAFLAVVFGICMLLTLIGWPISPEHAQELIIKLRQMPTVLIVIGVALVLSAGGVFVLYGLISERLNRRTAALLEKNAICETAVSFETLAQIAERAAKNRNEVSSCKTKVYAVGNSVRIDVRVVTSPTVSLVKMTRTLQNEVSTMIEEICGTSVGLVDVTVDQTDAAQKRA
jgi:hypothetical protein